MNLVFIKNWGNFKKGDIVENPTAVTKKALVEIHRVAEVQTDQELQTVLDQEIQQIEEGVPVIIKKSPEKSPEKTPPRGRASKEKKKRKR